MNVLHWLSSLSLLIESPANIQEAQHEFVILSEVIEHVVNVLSWACNYAADQLAHCALISKSLLVHVDRIGCREKCKRSMMIVGVSTRGVLFYHEACCGAGFHHVLYDRLQELSEVLGSCSYRAAHHYYFAGRMVHSGYDTDSYLVRYLSCFL